MTCFGEYLWLLMVENKVKKRDCDEVVRVPGARCKIEHSSALKQKNRMRNLKLRV